MVDLSEFTAFFVIRVSGERDHLRLDGGRV